MDTDAFWQLIADSLVEAPGRVARQEFLQERLAALTPDEIVAFQVHLDLTCDRAYSWNLVGAGQRIFDGWISDDGFEYFRLWLIGRGRVAFEGAIADPDSLADLPEVQRLAGRHMREWDGDEEWPEWESLDYVAGYAFSQATGSDDEDHEIFLDTVEARLEGQSFRRALDGERWDARDESASALKVPRLAAMFPVNRQEPFNWFE
ncbi:hypothetical protein GCM10009839_46280 [Catenulispora yoronensis]|uniref:DUF4240 domain-containing protein n=1 Tax=Catenulispora yoronensis TaxID=450799 RepID=A0ABP5G465_9ACTN